MAAPPPVWGQAPQVSAWAPGAQPPTPPPMPWAPPPTAPAPAKAGGSRPARVRTALVLSFLGLFLCGPLAFIGALVARHELDGMNHGEVDPSNRAKVVRAYGIGLGATILWLFMAALWIFVITRTRTPR